MFIFDLYSVVIFCIVAVVVYLVLDYIDDEAFKSIESKIFTALAIALIITLIYSYFLSGGNESLLTQSYTEAGQFGVVSGMESLKEMASF